MWTYQLVGLLQRPLCPADGCLARLAGRLLDLLDLLRQVGLHQLQLGFVAAKALGAGFCVDEVGHGRGVGRNCKIMCGVWWCVLNVWRCRYGEALIDVAVDLRSPPGRCCRGPHYAVPRSGLSSGCPGVPATSLTCYVTLHQVCTICEHTHIASHVQFACRCLDWIHSTSIHRPFRHELPVARGQLVSTLTTFPLSS